MLTGATVRMVLCKVIRLFGPLDRAIYSLYIPPYPMLMSLDLITKQGSLVPCVGSILNNVADDRLVYCEPPNA